MRRHVATFVAAALLLSIAGPRRGPGRPRERARRPGFIRGRRRCRSGGPLDRPLQGRHRRRRGHREALGVGRVRVDRTFTNGIRGFAPPSATTRSPASVMTRRSPRSSRTSTSSSRPRSTRPASAASARLSPAAQIDGVDERVDADVAIVDTGIAKIADLNVVGGHDCSTSTPSRWRDVQGHGTHVAGTVGAIDNGAGVVGVAPGVRLWAVKILDDTGSGLLSWYVCGLDWILAQREPGDPSRPRIEAVNMSVAKWGTDTPGCGEAAGDILHAAICRLVKDGVTVVAAAANDSGNASQRVPASYDEVITVSALADSDGKPADSAATAASRGGPTTPTTRSPTSATSARTSISSPPASASTRPCPAASRTAPGPRWRPRT